MDVKARKIQRRYKPSGKKLELKEKERKKLSYQVGREEN